LVFVDIFFAVADGDILGGEVERRIHVVARMRYKIVVAMGGCGLGLVEGIHHLVLRLRHHHAAGVHER
jgi:hypothetical protein